ncbi:pyridoxine 5'-phosphate synthase [Candidatus Magnetaquicoccus inordinatus]|uniref:pyridoxine 5'-phosphate synthase n=1 Tax=Candidatus Magnetaquicoccus inordinatus TaxID=2496818 RepID=UPI00102AE4CC|nr:pyridoxine 5'-phosphate synthase [Candidatus Magnetaquicoccus inordinatus]
MIKLGVNIDHVATIRQARAGISPDPVAAALAAERGGADGITAHLREDRRHVQERDIALLLEMVQTKLNLEMAVTNEMLDYAFVHKPADCCLVPEKRKEITTEGGLNVVDHLERVHSAVRQLTRAEIRVSLFIDPDSEQLHAAAATKAPVIELHTGRFVAAKNPAQRKKEWEKLWQAAALGQELGLIVHAGHGLDYHNVQEIAAIPGIQELNIGHAIVARAVFDGMEKAVSDMKRLMREAALCGG